MDFGNNRIYIFTGRKRPVKIKTTNRGETREHVEQLLQTLGPIVKAGEVEIAAPVVRQEKTL